MVIKPREPENTAFINTSRIGAKVGDELTLDATESSDFTVFDKPVAMEAFPGLDDQRRF